jgi:hypothetical protein
MKTQINALVKGNSNRVGTNLNIRTEIAKKVILENPEQLLIILRGCELKLTKISSVSGKTIYYTSPISIELYKSFFGDFGIINNNPQPSIIVNMDMTIALYSGSKKGFFNYIDESEIIII